MSNSWILAMRPTSKRLSVHALRRPKCTVSSSLSWNRWNEEEELQPRDTNPNVIHIYHRQIMHVRSACTPSNSTLLHNFQRAYFSSDNLHNNDDDISIEPQMDLFGEPNSFVGVHENAKRAPMVEPAAEALDTFLVAVVTKGSSASDGGDEEGVATMSAHSSAIAWTDLLKHSALWNTSQKSLAPMLAVVAVAPLLAQAGVGYIRHVDTLLAQTTQPSVQMLSMAKIATTMKDHPHLAPREKSHLQALDCLLNNDHPCALRILLKLLQQCPGDVLALSLAIDIAQTLGDKQAAIRAAGSVASYWHERGDRQRNILGYAIVTAWVSLGFAVGGRFTEAERLASQALRNDVSGAGGISTWALAHAFDAEGRTSEGISFLAGYDGVKAYESCGLSFFDSRIGGYGARFSLDREGMEGGKASLRMYDTNFDRVLHYSGFASGQRWTEPSRKAPTTRGQRLSEGAQKATKSVFQSLFGGGKDEAAAEPSNSNTPDKEETTNFNEEATLEDVLTWMPPTPQILTEATLLLLRLTINGTVATNDARWLSLRNAWKVMNDIYQQESLGDSDAVFEFYPFGDVVSSLFAKERLEKIEDPGNALNQIRAGMQMMGELMNLGYGEEMKEIDLDETAQNQWKRVAELLSSAVDANLDSETGAVLNLWEMDGRPIVEHAICYAACLSEDPDALSVARSICSQGVCLRPNSPEQWWRYSVVLDLVGDETAAEDARAASISFGSGEGVSSP